MKIADADQSFARGKYMGTSTQPLLEAERFKRCPVCGGYIDILDLSWVRDHEGRCRTRCRIGRSKIFKLRREPIFNPKCDGKQVLPHRVGIIKALGAVLCQSTEQRRKKQPGWNVVAFKNLMHRERFVQNHV
jgi:hypothetical protein